MRPLYQEPSLDSFYFRLHVLENRPSKRLDAIKRINEALQGYEFRACHTTLDVCPRYADQVYCKKIWENDTKEIQNYVSKSLHFGCCWLFYIFDVGSSGLP